MTRDALLTTLAQRLGRPTPLSASDESRLLAMLNEVQRDILAMPGMARLRREPVSFASVASQPRYGLPNIAKIERMWEATNDRALQEMSLSLYRTLSPDPTAVTGTPEAFVWAGYGWTAAQPADASSLFVKSTSASDTTVVAYIEGEITGGYPASASVTLTGTTAVDVSASVTTWVRVTKFYLSGPCVGVVTLHEDSGAGTELARLGIGQTAQQYSQFYLYPTPSEAITYSVDAVIELTDLAGPLDEPRLPRDFHDLLIYGALSREYEKTMDERMGLAETRYQRGLSRLRYWLHETASGTMAMTREANALTRWPAWYPEA
jgi:hypothetical protein